MLPPTLHNFILFELDFDEKFPLLRLLLFLRDLKSTIFLYKITKIHITPLQIQKVILYSITSFKGWL